MRSGEEQKTRAGRKDRSDEEVNFRFARCYTLTPSNVEIAVPRP